MIIITENLKPGRFCDWQFYVGLCVPEPRRRFGINPVCLHLRLTHITASAEPPMSVWKSTVAVVLSFILLLHNAMHKPIYILHAAERSRGTGGRGSLETAL